MHQGFLRKSDKGMTFFEVLVVMGILAIVGGFALFVSMDAYRSSNFGSDRDLLIATLQRARAQAMNNVCLGSAADCNSDGKKHGVAIKPSDHPNSFVIFQSASDYAGRSVSDKAQDAMFPANPGSAFTITPSAADIVFAQLSGIVPVALKIEVDQAGHKAEVHIETNGRIWTENI